MNEQLLIFLCFCVEAAVGSSKLTGALNSALWPLHISPFQAQVQVTYKYTGRYKVRAYRCCPQTEACLAQLLRLFSSVKCKCMFCQTVRHCRCGLVWRIPFRRWLTDHRTVGFMLYAISRDLSFDSVVYKQFPTASPPDRGEAVIARRRIINLRTGKMWVRYWKGRTIR